MNEVRLQRRQAAAEAEATEAISQSVNRALWEQQSAVQYADLERDLSYRFLLSRWWDEMVPPLILVMLNPSKAGAHLDDPTIRRCVGFARSFGLGGLAVLNLTAIRSTDPKRLDLIWTSQQAATLCPGFWLGQPKPPMVTLVNLPIERINQIVWAETIRELVRRWPQRRPTVVAAWGAGFRSWMGPARRQFAELATKYHYVPFCFGWTKRGQPRHPLMLRRDTQLVEIPHGELEAWCEMAPAQAIQ